MMDDRTTSEEAMHDLQRQIDALGALVREQQQTIERLTQRAPAATLVAAAPPAEEPKRNRRSMLTKLLGATAAAAVLTVAKEPVTASAESRTTILTGSASTGNYGIAAAVQGLDPGTLIGNVTGTGFGVIGTFGSPGYAPPFNGGVLGQGSGAFYGVIGLSENNPGVFGRSTTGVGVQGRSDGTAGVWGSSPTGFGVLGQSSTGAGVFGDSTSPGGYGLYGRSTAGAGVLGTTTQGYAGALKGPGVIQGPLTLTRSYPKSAAVAHPDGSLRRVYCQEATEAWFEDFGSVAIQNGRALVDLDPDFAAVVRGDDYMVFLTEVGDSGGLFVSKKAPRRFEIRSRGGLTVNGTCDYRIVSRRRDNVGKRLEHVDLRNLKPTIKLPEPLK
jgi:hypothetical protein